ncbi:hypothetical protein K0M31_010025 [Melipona bicolor]|uniref:Uncharacterized protein n=1 Tax=Melipona bicolor TaxID=60889 RepID=A0AA40FM97_9HYME|nr:hypothetical protein K0M31_010025 [Melipona bicolor]
MTRIRSVVLAVTIRNRDFIVQRAASDPQGGRPSQLDRTPEHQSAVSVINGELLAARTSPWEFREVSTTQLSVPVHIQVAIDLGRDPIPPLVQMR